MSAQPIVAAARNHVIADVTELDDTELLDDENRLAVLMIDACRHAGASVLDVASHRFTPHGVTVLCLLAESHASIHTWPEVGAAFLDAFTCGDVHPGRIITKALDNLGQHTASITTVTTGHNN